MAQARSYDILLVEDNAGDVELVCEILADSGLHCQVHVVEDGEAAIDFLSRQGKYTQVPVPDLILLDLNLPRRDGKEVLQYIKQDTKLSAIPTVIMTSSEAERDIAMCYALHANAYVIKPTDLQSFTETVQSIGRFWLETARLPPRTVLL